jgi:hypothetical protein
MIALDDHQGRLLRQPQRLRGGWQNRVDAKRGVGSNGPSDSLAKCVIVPCTGFSRKTDMRKKPVRLLLSQSRRENQGPVLGGAERLYNRSRCYEFWLFLTSFEEEVILEPDEAGTEEAEWLAELNCSWRSSR